MGRRVCIVFEETEPLPDGSGVGFNVYLEGISKERAIHLRGEGHEASTAEFWGQRCFAIVIDAISKTGAIQSVGRKP